MVFDHTCGRGDDLYYGKGPSKAVANSDHRRRFVEHAIPLHAPLYVVGQARERADVVAPEIAHDPRAEMFLISTRTQDQVRRGLSWQFWLCGIFGVAFGVGGIHHSGRGTASRPLKRPCAEVLVAGGSFCALAWVARLDRHGV